MKLLKEYMQFPDVKMDDRFKEFLSHDDVKKAFQKSDFEELYNLSKEYVGEYFNSKLSSLLLSLDINPIKYLTVVPTYSFVDIDLDDDDVQFNPQLKTIGENAFSSNTAITLVSIPDSCKYINNYAFSNCDNLQEIKLGNNVEQLGSGCFFNDNKLLSITLPRSMQSIDLGTFSGSGITEIQYQGTSDEFIQKLRQKTLIGSDTKVKKIICSDKTQDLKEYFNDPELIQPDIVNSTGFFRIKGYHSYTLTVRKYDPKSDTFGFGWTSNQGVVHSSEITFTSEAEANNFIQKANLTGVEGLRKTNKPYSLYKVNTEAGPCYLTEQYINWLFVTTVTNNRDLNKKLPSRLIVRP